MNPELKALFKADQDKHKQPPSYGTPEYDSLRQQDANRRQRVLEIISEVGLHSAEELYHAALILHHGDAVAEVWQAHTLARQALEQDYRPARWLTAASYDRWLMYQGQPQKYGTQIVPDGKRQRVWDVDPATTDAERAAWDVRPLAEQHTRAAELSRSEPMPPMERAPTWLKAAIVRWQTKESEV
jgi:hypothetical protein